MVGRCIGAILGVSLLFMIVLFTYLKTDHVASMFHQTDILFGDTNETFTSIQPPVESQSVNRYLQSINISTIEPQREVTSRPNIPAVEPSTSCRMSYKRSHFLLPDFQTGRTGNALLQVNCLIASAEDLCLTPVIDSNNFYFKRSFNPVFDLHGIQTENITNNASFHKLPNNLSDKSLQKYTNWTIVNRCYRYKQFLGHRELIQKSVTLKNEFIQLSEQYLETHFERRSTVAIHVRRTDRVNLQYKTKYEYADLEWYKAYIDKAMDYLRQKQSNLSFIFVSDDYKWCKKHFKGKYIHYSPFKSAGYDLALISCCDHVVVTIGTFGWTGAWFGTHQSVIYPKAYLPYKFRKLYLPWWVGI